MLAEAVQVAILTPAHDYAAKWAWAYDIEASALTDAGMTVEAVSWMSGPRDWSRFDLILPLVAWGYHQHYAAWRALLDQFERDRLPIANPLPLLRWNSDKAYLTELAAAGVATVPTLEVPALDERSLAAASDHFCCRDLVVKPPISASAYGTFRLAAGDPFPEAVRGWRMMVQPWIEAILDCGEYSLIFFDGELSHGLSKAPKSGEFRVQPEYGGIIERCDPPPGAEDLAKAALAAAPEPATYARVDIVVGNDGRLQIIELELIEPALFLDHAPEAGPAFARAVKRAVESLNPLRRAS